MTIYWLLGTLILWMVTTAFLYRDGVFPAALTQFASVLCLLLGYACLSGLGFFAGAFTVLWLLIRICRRINGAPFSVGDFVTILVGPKTGTVARVYELTRGQGGGLLPRLGLGAEARDKYLDMFDDYTLLRYCSDGIDSGTHRMSQADKFDANAPSHALQ